MGCLDGWIMESGSFNCSGDFLEINRGCCHVGSETASARGWVVLV